MSLKMYFNNKVILIVGASTGIGRAMALKLARAGATLIITARSQDKLDSLENEILNNGGQCLAIAADALIVQEVAEHIIYALRTEKANYMFPLKMRWLIRLALLLPQPVLNWFLKRDVPGYKHSN